jgi:DNA-binding NarL/FixJ family response regulator
VTSLAAVLTEHGAQVRVLTDSSLPAPRRADQIDALLLESPLPSEVKSFAAIGPPVIVLTEHTGGEGDAPIGAFALLHKNGSLAELSLAIKAARAERARTAGLPLTLRQRQVLELLADGLDNAHIAERLGISQRTARAHVSGVLERLGVENRTQAAVTALRSGWLG